jgi:EAL domain-containing protein (putative c-di-GMP-specific phosphodiesterase class I)
MSAVWRLLRLQPVRLAGLLLVAVEAVAVVVEKLSGFDAFPDVLDVALGVVAIVACLLVGVGTALHGSTSDEVVQDADDLAGRREQDRDAAEKKRRQQERVENVIEGNAYPTISYSPVANLENGEVVGYEASTHFGPGSSRAWFVQAFEVGLGPELELKSIRRALDGFEGEEQTFLSMPCSPATLIHGELTRLLSELPGVSHVVLELTDSADQPDYRKCRQAAQKLRRMGVRLAVGHVDTGYASVRHIIELRPEIIKLDHVASAAGGSSTEMGTQTLLSLAQLVDATLMGRGVNDEATRVRFRDMGIKIGQGSLLVRSKVTGPRAVPR